MGTNMAPLFVAARQYSHRCRPVSPTNATIITCVIPESSMSPTLTVTRQVLSLELTIGGSNFGQYDAKSGLQANKRNAPSGGACLNVPRIVNIGPTSSSGLGLVILMPYCAASKPLLVAVFLDK